MTFFTPTTVNLYLLIVAAIPEDLFNRGKPAKQRRDDISYCTHLFGSNYENLDIFGKASEPTTVSEQRKQLNR